MSVTRYNFEVASQFKITDQIVYVEARPSKSGKYVRYSDYAALRVRHNALKDAVAWERECNDASESVYDENWLCEECGGVIGYIEDGRAISCAPWSMSEDERELCEKCWEKEEFNYSKKYFDLRMLIKQLRQHEINGVDEDYPFKKYVAKRAYYQKLVDDFIRGDNT